MANDKIQEKILLFLKDVMHNQPASTLLIKGYLHEFYGFFTNDIGREIWNMVDKSLIEFTNDSKIRLK